MDNKNDNKQNPFDLAIKFDFNKWSMKKVLIVLSIATAIIIFTALYFGLISFSIYNVSLRYFIIFLLLIWSLPILVVYNKNRAYQPTKIKTFNSIKLGWKIPLLIAVILFVINLGLSLFSTPLFMAESYRNLITVDETKKFETEIENYDKMKIAIVDKYLAAVLGEKKLGDDNLGSQFTINNYTLIHYDNDLYWVGVLDYTGFFKWTDRMSKGGSPGYIKISATNPNKSEIVYTDLKYIPSAYFWEDMDRQFYGQSMNKLRDIRTNFELDDDGNPMFVQAVLNKKFAATNGDDTEGILIMNPKNGSVTYYANGEEPNWVDRVQPTEVVLQQLNYWGQYVNGFWNTVFGKEKLMQTSSGYNYLYNKGNFYLYTGMTSTGGDQSIVGMIVTDMRTKETNFFKLNGATELAAQGSAEGKVSDYGYKAGFPTLINFNGEPTYFMSLKDGAGLIKKYAYVNVTDYSKVAIGDDILSAQTSYTKLIGNTTEQKLSLVIDEIIVQTQEGNTVYLIKFTDPAYSGIFKAHYSISDELAFAKAGDSVTISISGNYLTSFRKN